MSMIPKCVTCDRPVASVYAPEAWCERCKRERENAATERDLRFTIEQQRRVA